MKIETSELVGSALDWAVAVCEGYTPVRHSRLAAVMVEKMSARGVMQLEHISSLRYSTNWAQGGPIIEREKLDVCWTLFQGWVSLRCTAINEADLHQQEGPTLLVAAMRCYVASKLGDEVDVPEELLK